MRNGIVHHKSDCKSCVIPTADRNKMDGHCLAFSTIYLGNLFVIALEYSDCVTALDSHLNFLNN